jgi:alpha-L-rhamnosidase
MHAFYLKWLQDIRDVQDPETGALTACQAPCWFRSESLTWGLAYFLIPWYLHRHYGDRDVLRAYFPFLRHYFAYLESKTTDGVMQIRDIYGDWLAIEPTPARQVVEACHFFSAVLLSRIAEAVGQRNAAHEYRERAAQIAASYNARHFHGQSGYYGENQNISRFGNAFPLYLGMVPNEAQAQVFDNLLWDVTVARGGVELGGGFFSTKYTIELLSREGRDDVVYDLFARTAYPSWGFMIEHGATAIWERWEHKVGWEMNSHNHPPFCSPDTWFYQGLAGVGESREEEGRRVFLVQPFLHPELTIVQAAQDTPWGRIAVRWERGNGEIRVSLHVPGNCRALLDLKRPHGATPAVQRAFGSGHHIVAVAEE